MTEQLIQHVTESLWIEIDRQGLKRVDIARRLGRSRTFITQVLGGSRNMTLRTLGELAKALDLNVLLQLAPESADARDRPGAGVAARAQTEAVTEFGLLSSAAVGRAAGSSSKNISLTASRWKTKRRIFAVKHRGRVAYFPFQFDATTGLPKAIVRDVLKAFPANVNGWEVAKWFCAKNPLLQHKRPVDLLDEDAPLVRAAANLLRGRA